MDEIKKTVMSNLRNIVAVRQLRQSDIADALGVSQGSVSNWLNGYATPDLVKLIELCRFLGISMDMVTGVDTSTEAEQMARLLVSLSPDQLQLTKDFIAILQKAAEPVNKQNDDPPAREE